MDWTQSSGNSSVIMNMMKKMGYVEGKGLGAKKQGIVEPIIPSVRKGRRALGAYGKENIAVVGQKSGETSDAALSSDDEVEILSTSEDEIEVLSFTKSKRKDKFQSKTIDELMADDGIEVISFTGPASDIKIIDLTGPQEKVYNGFDSYLQRAPDRIDIDPTNKFGVPELHRNLDTLLFETEEEIRKNDRRAMFLKGQNISFEAVSGNIRMVINNEEEEVARMKELFGLVAELAKNENQTLEAYKKLLERLQNEFAEEFRIYRMDSIIVSTIVPTLEQALARMNMNPVENSEFTEFHAVLDCAKLVGTNMTCQILMKAFFPYWIDALKTWLRSPGMVLSEVAWYYKEWSNRFPPYLKELPSIKAELYRGLNLIAEAKRNLSTPLPSETSQPPPKPT